MTTAAAATAAEYSTNVGHDFTLADAFDAAYWTSRPPEPMSKT